MSEHTTMQDQITARAMKDETFRQQLLSNPRQTLERELGITLPTNVTVLVHEETANTILLVLPSHSQAGGLVDLSDAELEQTIGGANQKAGATTFPGSMSGL
jgi:hypothetical protein